MVGRNAAAVVRACEYEARVAIEIIQKEEGNDDVLIDAKGALNLSCRSNKYLAWPDREMHKVRRREGRERLSWSPPESSGGGDAGAGRGLEYRKPGPKTPKYRQTPVILDMPPPTVRKGGKYLDILPAWGYSGGGNSISNISNNSNNGNNPFATRQNQPTGIILRAAREQTSEQTGKQSDEPPWKKAKTARKRKRTPPLGKTPPGKKGGQGRRKVPPRKPMRPADEWDTTTDESW